MMCSCDECHPELPEHYGDSGPENLEKINREVAEWLGMCWHEWSSDPIKGLTCKNCHWHLSSDWFRPPDNPNFILHPVDLLKEMMKRRDFNNFMRFSNNLPDEFGWISDEHIRIQDVTDTTGLLLLKVAEWPGFKELRK